MTTPVTTADAERGGSCECTRPTGDGLDPVAGRAGFSLVEMLIGIVLTGVVGAAVVGVFVDQSEFYQENSRQVTANKSLRGTADLLSTELRMVRQGDVLEAEPESFTARYGVSHGVVCHTTSTEAFVYLHRVPDVDPETVRYLEPRYDGDWQTGLDWVDVEEDGSQECADHGSPSGMPAGHYRVVTSLVSMPEVGSLIYGTDRVTYAFEERNGRIVLQRDGRRIAGPFRRDGQYIRYFRQDGTEVTGSNLDDIAYVRFDATARGHDPSPRFEGDRAISLRVPFRNQ